MSKIKKYTLGKWCAVLAALLAVMGFQACHRAQKVVITDDTPTDTLSTVVPSPIHGEIIALYGVPPSKYKKIEKQNIEPKQIEK